MAKLTLEVKDHDQRTDSLQIEQGYCYVVLAYDVARSIDLREAERRLRGTPERQTIPRKRPTPDLFEHRPAPLGLSRQREPLQGRFFQTTSTVDILVYDFGAVAVNYTIPLNGSFDSLLPMSEELYANAALLEDSRARVEDLLAGIGTAATSPQIAPLVEDYNIFHIEKMKGSFSPSQFCESERRQIAQILRSEKRPLSGEEITDAVAAHMSYGAEDIVVVDWNAALLVDQEGEDVREILRFANVELLEMRYLDQRLGRALDQSWEIASNRSRRRFRNQDKKLHSLAELQMDNATLFEGVDNALKLVGDQYLARVYRLVSRRFHLDDWDAGIVRKLGTLERIYQKMSDQAGARRMEVLEWIVIVLIAFSIVLELVRFKSA